MHDGLDQLVTATVLFLPRLVVSIATFMGFWVAAAVLRAIVARVGGGSDLGDDVRKLIQRVLKAGLLTFGAVTALGTTGIDVSALVAGLGLTGFALGFALRDILANIVAGTLILIYRPFHRHDHVSVAGFEGTVSDIDLRYTTLQTEGKRILIPNSTLFTNAISVVEGAA
jgi:small-conductance mechanosensitive channel